MFDGIATDAEIDADQRAREDDPTPRGVARSILAAALPKLATTPWHPFAELATGRFDPVKSGRYGGPIRVIDVGAGFGCWSSEARRLAALQGWPIHTTGVEVDFRKREHLAKWCDHVFIDDWHRGILHMHILGEDRWDLAIGNPHFSALTHDDPSQSMPAVLLDHAPAVLLFHQEQSFQKSAAGCRIWHAYKPAAVFHVPGSIRFRQGINPKNGKPWGADSRCYQATLWLRGWSGPTTSIMLPWLPAEDRRWRVPPGIEDVLEAKALGLPLAPSFQEAA